MIQFLTLVNINFDKEWLIIIKNFKTSHFSHQEEAKVLIQDTMNSKFYLLVQHCQNVLVWLYIFLCESQKWWSLIVFLTDEHLLFTCSTLNTIKSSFVYCSWSTENHQELYWNQVVRSWFFREHDKNHEIQWKAVILNAEDIAWKWISSLS